MGVNVVSRSVHRAIRCRLRGNFVPLPATVRRESTRPFCVCVCLIRYNENFRGPDEKNVVLSRIFSPSKDIGIAVRDARWGENGPPINDQRLLIADKLIDG